MLVASGLAASSAEPALAHSVATLRLPAPDARLSVPPKRIVIEFNEAIEAAFSEIKVSDGNGSSVAEGKGGTLCQQKSCKLELPALVPGKYKVSYSVLSVDGHVVKSDYVFTVTGGAP